MRGSRTLIRVSLGVAALGATLSAAACLETVFDITTDERLVRVPATSATAITVETGKIELPTRLGTDKIVDSVTLTLEAANLHEENPVEVEISAASSVSPNAFGPVAMFTLGPSETREIQIVQAEPDAALVKAVHSDFVNIRFESRSPRSGIGEIEFRFTLRVRAHKTTPGSGAGTLLFY